MAEVSENDRRLFLTNYTLMAFRDAKYHNTAHAIAELIDNSLEANAEHVQLLCMEGDERAAHRTTRRVQEIAILDDGYGMDADTLTSALQFGGGTKHQAISGIGKYGMGLPTASMSQCGRVEVWTWQNGVQSALYSLIDADEVAKEKDYRIPEAQAKPIPDMWHKAGSEEIYASSSGTLIVWSKLGELNWTTGKAIFNHVEREVGRIHRHFLSSGVQSVSAKTFDSRFPLLASDERIFQPNDPLYLMSPTSLKDGHWTEEPMFEPWGQPKRYQVTVGGREETVTVRYSIVKKEALETPIEIRNPGDTPRGKHAAHNIGVSVVREDREILMERAFQREGGSTDRPQNRWWGCEVEFGRGADDLFGLDHTKQMVTRFTQAARTLGGENRPRQTVLEEIGLEDQPIYQIAGDIANEIRAIMREIASRMNKRVEGRRGGNSASTADTAAKAASVADQSAVADGREQPTQTDIQREAMARDERVAGLQEGLREDGYTESEASNMAAELVNEGIAYRFGSSHLDGYQMFSVRREFGVFVIRLNTNHALYALLEELEPQLNELGDRDDPAFLPLVALRLLLLAWARLEDHSSEEEARQIQKIAAMWGEHVHKDYEELTGPNSMA